MMYLQGMSGQQISDALSLPLGTVKSRTRLALAKLKIGIPSTYKPD
jgi:RNA polymerase sigma-70 factor (ECF subfamily)